jgi:hypothetical protein
VIVNARLADGAVVQVRVSEHAVDRYQQRVKPYMPAESAAAELAALISMSVVREGTAPWLSSPQAALFHVDLGTITVAVDPDPRDTDRLLARTVLVCGGFSRRRRPGAPNAARRPAGSRRAARVRSGQ